MDVYNLTIAAKRFADLGGAVQDQAEAILINSADLSTMNGNALRMICVWLQECKDLFNDEDFSAEVDEYIAEIENSPEESDGDDERFLARLTRDDGDDDAGQ